MQVDLDFVLYNEANLGRDSNQSVKTMYIVFLTTSDWLS